MEKNNKEIENYVINMYNLGNSCRLIGDTLGINSVTVFNILKRNNIQTRTKGGIYKLPIDQIVSDYKNGIKVTELASKYSVDINTIYNYLKNAGVERNYIYINQSLRRDYFKNIDTYDKAYFLGFIISDGSVSDTNNCLSICIQRQDYYILEILRQKMQNENPLYYSSTRPNEVTFHCKSRELLDDLAKYGVVPRKTYNNYIPQINEYLLHHLIRGTFDANGWISYKSKQLGYCAGNSRIVTDFRDILVSRIGVYPVKIIQSGEHTFQCSWGSESDIMKIFMYMYQYGFNECFLQRKFEKFWKIPSKIIV